jgi:hypothetical protein
MRKTVSIIMIECLTACPNISLYFLAFLAVEAVMEPSRKNTFGRPKIARLSDINWCAATTGGHRE